MSEPPRPPHRSPRSAKAPPFGVRVASAGATDAKTSAEGADDAPADREAPARDALPSLDALESGVRACDRAVLARAISLVESSNPAHRDLADALLDRLSAAGANTFDSMRVGITGVPGAGKSTFIERLGVYLCDKGARVAVLAVDPSSAVTGGSILGDRTRMPRLANQPNAFIRPSPSRGSLGGVAPRTRDVVRVCEAAGFNTVLIETVGVGQSEAMIANLVDCVLALALPNAGDELQALKRGLLENVDVIAVNKADGENADAATRAAAQLRASLSLTRRTPGETSPDDHAVAITTCSAMTGHGIDHAWTLVHRAVDRDRASGRLAARRREQDVRWMRALVEERVLTLLRESAPIRNALQTAEERVRQGQESPSIAADSVIQAIFGQSRIR